MKITLKPVTHFGDKRDFGYELFGLEHELIYLGTWVEVRFASPSGIDGWTVDGVPLYRGWQNKDSCL